MQSDLVDAVALVTGASGNIGQAICSSLAAKGATVIASDVAPVGDKMLRLDVTCEEDWRASIEQITREHGRLDILVNNAGVAPMGRITAMPLADWRRCQAINVEGILLGLRAAMSLLVESGKNRTGGSAVINISSAAADRAAPMSAAYCTSKAAASMLSRAAALECSSLGYSVRVNAVHPGAVQSDLIDSILEGYSKILGGPSVSQLREAVISRIPLGRMLVPEEVADVVAFLASSDARFIHGTSIHVDGGYTA